MEVKIEAAPSFVRQFKKLKKKYASLNDDYRELLESLMANPYLGTDLGRGAHKIRLSIKSKGKGKSGGARVITFVVALQEVEATTVTLLAIYDKSQIESLSDSEIDSLIKDLGQ